MDQVERSFHEEQSAITESIRLARATKTDLKPTGVCYNKACMEDIQPGKLFCNSSCANEYQRFKKLSCRLH